MLGSFLKVCHHPRTRGAIFRRTLKQSSNTGGLFDAAVNLFTKVDPKVKILTRDMELRFSSGAQLKLSYLDDPKDKYNWQGAELSWLGFDEIQQLDFASCIYLFSRLRSVTVDYPLHIRATGNPDPDAWIKQLVEPDLGPDGIPLPETRFSPRTRFFVNTPNGIILYDTREEAESIHGKGKQSGIMSFMFQPGNIYSNPILMKNDPSYVSRLKSLPRTEMERLLLGSWTSRETASGLFKREWCTFVDHPNEKAHRRVRAWDISSTKPSESNPDPDFTAGVLLSRDRDGIITVEDAQRIRDRPHVVKELIFDTAKSDGYDVTVVLPLDPGATAGAWCRQLQKELGERGYTVKMVRPSQAKLHRFRPFATVAEAKFVQVIRDAPWTKFYLDELEAFTGQRSKIHDDLVDATSDGTFVLLQTQELPMMIAPSISVPSQPMGGLPNFQNPYQQASQFTIPTFNLKP